MDGYALAARMGLEHAVPWKQLGFASRGVLAVLAYARADVPYDSGSWMYEFMRQWLPLVPLVCYKVPTERLFHAREVDHPVHNHQGPFLSASTLKGAAHYARNLNTPVILPLDKDTYRTVIHVPSVVEWARRSRVKCLKEMTCTQSLRSYDFLKRVEKEDEYILPFRRQLVLTPETLQFS